MSAGDGERPEPLGRLFLRFLRFGLLAWGGPVAQIAMIKRELVEEERWVDPPRFNRLLAIYQVLPGPEAHELCVHLGMVRRGRAGGILAGLGFMLPGLILMLALSWLYAHSDFTRPPYAALFLGVQVGVIALIARAVHRIGEHVLTDRGLWLAAALAALAAWLGVPFWITLPAAGLAYACAARGWRWTAAAVVAVAALLAVLTMPAAALLGPATPTARPALVAAGSVGALPLFLSGLTAGLFTFGGAYTAIPFVRGDAVYRGWVSDGQFLDGLALSGIIPAPLIIFATFVGFQAGGLAGALAITAGVFLPAFGFALIFFDRLEPVIDDHRWRDGLAGVAAGVVGLIAVTALDLGSNVARAVPSLPLAALLFAACLALLYRWESKHIMLAVIAVSAAAGVAAFG
ncbi:MAG: chromate efflux transporter [Sphingomicrobium sp.]